jgi:DinB superfamily
MTPEHRTELVSRYRLGAAALLETLARLPEEYMDRSPDPDGWTPRMVAHHVADAELTGGERLRRLVAEDRPQIKAYDQETYSRRLHYDRPVASSAALIAAVTESNAELLERLSDEEWTRAGVHEESGAYTVESWLRIYSEHCQAHAEQVARASS